MSKLGKTEYKRVDRDFYPTGIKPLEPLIPHLSNNLVYSEPCAGAYDLVNNLKTLRPDIVCDIAFDIFPQDNRIIKKNALDIGSDDIKNCDCFITNPPYKWDMFEPITNHLLSMLPVWYLIPADFMHNKRMIPFMKTCSKIVSVGRIKWYPDSKATSTDNFCWYKFETTNISYTEFYHRSED